MSFLCCKFLYRSTLRLLTVIYDYTLFWTWLCRTNVLRIFRLLSATSVLLSLMNITSTRNIFWPWLRYLLRYKTWFHFKEDDNDEELHPPGLLDCVERVPVFAVPGHSRLGIRVQVQTGGEKCFSDGDHSIVGVVRVSGVLMRANDIGFPLWFWNGCGGCSVGLTMGDDRNLIDFKGRHRTIHLAMTSAYLSLPTA